jgi:hypothetical protein
LFSALIFIDIWGWSRCTSLSLHAKFHGLVIFIVLYNGLPLILQANFGARADLTISECFSRAGRPDSRGLLARLVPYAVRHDREAGGHSALLALPGLDPGIAGRGPHGTAENPISAW